MITPTERALFCRNDCGAAAAAADADADAEDAVSEAGTKTVAVPVGPFVLLGGGVGVALVESTTGLEDVVEEANVELAVELAEVEVALVLVALAEVVELRRRSTTNTGRQVKGSLTVRSRMSYSEESARWLWFWVGPELTSSIPWYWSTRW